MTNVTPVGTNTGLKNFIIGKGWLTSQNGRAGGSIRMNRDLPTDITLKADSLLIIVPNTKRPDKNDADFTVSILLPVGVADSLIAKTNELVAARKATETMSFGSTSMSDIQTEEVH